MRTTGNRWVSRIFIAALLLAVLCVGASDAAGRDPIGTRRIVPKSRLTVNATSNQTINTYNLMRATTFTGQDASEPTAKNVIELGAAGLSDWWAFAQASVAADIPGRDPISFLGGPNVTVDGGVCNAYFLYDPSNNDPNIIIYMELLDGEESLGKIELTHVPAPTYMITDYMRVGADISTTLVADDWSGDGFSDYILTYRVYSGRTAYGSNGFYYTDVQHVYVYIDGQSLYDAVTSYGESALIKKTVIQTPSSTNMTAAPTSQYNIPAVSTRTAIGDVDNDGVNEFVVHAANLNGDILRVYDVSADISGAAQLSQIGGDMTLYGSGGYTNYYNANVGVAVGDLDGDGYAEICTLHTYQETPPSNPANHSCYLMRHIWKYSGGSITHIGGFDLGAIMDVRTIHNRFSTGAWIALPPLEMAIADFNNDGRQDLAYMFWSLSDGPYLCIDTFNTSDSNWPNTNTATGHAFATGAGNNPHYSMAAGYFKPLDNETFTDKGAPKQLALVFYRNVNPYMLEWSLYDVDTNCNLRQIGSTISDPITTDTTDLVASFTVIAADTSNESLVIGNPIPVSVTSVTPLVVMQAPPRHRDIVSGDFSVNGANPPDANGNSYPDAFSTLLSYETQYSSTTSSQTVSSTTKDTSVSFGAAVDTKTSVGIPGIAEATVSAAAKYSNKQTESSTQKFSQTVATSLASAAGMDDMVYYTSTTYTMWRYPVLYPANATTTTDPETGEKMQAFLQYVAPSSTSSTILPSSGRNLSWYEPLRDNRNLFTYPKDVTETEGYPKTTADTPWKDGGIQGFLMGNPSDVDIGTADASSGSETISNNASESQTSSIKNTLGVSAGVSAKVASVGEYSVSATNDDMWKTTSLTQTDASTTKGLTLNWPGNSLTPVKPYVNLSGFGWDDQAFTAGVAFYTQDDGSINAAYSVESLKSARQAASSALWGANSPYSKSPDPGLLLPFRFNSNGEHVNTSDAYSIRGMRFANALYAGTLPTNTATTATFRIFNYSFVNTAAFTCDILFQPVSYMDGYPEAPDISKATTVIKRGLSVPAIEGRENGAGDNWHDVAFDWTTPAQDGTVGYIHVKINYTGAQLSVDNDWGNVLLGFYNPATLAALTDSRSSAMRADVSDDRGGLDLAIADVTVRDIEGNTLDKDALPLDRPFSIECKVAIDGSETEERQGALLVFIELFVNGDAAVASKHAPYIPRGGKHRFRIDYDPAIHKDLVELKTLTLVASTYEALQESDLTPDNHAETLTFAEKSDAATSSGSGGGCNAGIAGLALLTPALGAAAFRKRG